MNMLKEFHDLLEERPNEPEVMIMLTRKQADDLYEAIHRIITYEKNMIGRWIEKEDAFGDTFYNCSACGESWSTIDGNPWDCGLCYCPNCGAKMEEKNEFFRRKKLAMRYKNWLNSKSEENGFILADVPETFLVFLEGLGLLRDPSPVCVLMRAREDCEEYDRASGYTCDFSDKCASCKFNREVDE